MKFSLENILRKNIQELKPYTSARHEFTGSASVFLDANENAFGSPFDENYNRYPDPLQWQLKFQLAKIKGVPAENIAIGNGSDELIDLLFRICCNPSIDNVIICPPTYGMYSVNAAINDVAVQQVPLTDTFQLNVEGILKVIDENTKLIFICSPNNPTGNSINKSDVEILLQQFNGLVVVDEAYINYSKQTSFIQLLTEFPNLVVLQTLSKAWGLAALRLGLCYASMQIIDIINKVKPPYNINEASQKIALTALNQLDLVNEWIRITIQERELLIKSLKKFSFVKKIYPSDANFILIKVANANHLYEFLISRGIVIRNRTKEIGCTNCLRITIGTPDENENLLQSLNTYNT
ncbi:MAG: histidinol-phosphate transaminase [Chitinophagaceae bacterium]|nr:histidinol-phosphate transaminase [Chitinophagaceae bacterium]